MVDDPAHATSERHGGSAVGAVDLGSDEVVLLGALDLGGRVELDGERLIGRYEHGEGDWLVERGTESEVFGRYAHALGQRLGRRAPRHPRIWCSWYSLYTGITEARLHEVLDDVSGMPFDVFQIDDGWQRGIGDWHANDDFASGMAALATRIREAGFEAWPVAGSLPRPSRRGAGGEPSRGARSRRRRRPGVRGQQLGRSVLRARPQPSSGPRARRGDDDTGRGRRLHVSQARLPLRGRAARPSTHRCATRAGLPGRGRAHPRCGGRRRVPARVRCADRAVRRSLRRDPGRPGRRARGGTCRS